MENSVFFAENGLTSTSANHIANLAKEAYTRTNEELNNITFSTTTISLLGGMDTKILQEGAKSLEGVTEKINHVIKLKSLIAWLREAIKEKDRLISEVKNISYEKAAEILDITIPEQPMMAKLPTIQDIIDNWNIKERNRYYYLDTVCSTIGKYIHPDGHFSQERKDLMRIKAKPNQVSGSGRDTVIYTYKPTVSEEEIDSLFFSLQDTYRTHQAELNGMKHAAQMECEQYASDKRAIYAKELEDYNSETREITAKITDWRENEVICLSKLKIAIPDSLRETYDFVSKLG